MLTSQDKWDWSDIETHLSSTQVLQPQDTGNNGEICQILRLRPVVRTLTPAHFLSTEPHPAGLSVITTNSIQSFAELGKWSHELALRFSMFYKYLLTWNIL